MLRMIQMVAVLVGISLISGMALGKLNSVTKDKIAENILRFKKVPAVVSIYEGMLGKLGGEDREALEQKFLDNRKELDVGEKEPLILFLIEKDGKPETVALERPGSGGYGGAVGVMVGFNLETGDLAGVGITAHSETPGIGDRMRKEAAGRVQDRAQEGRRRHRRRIRRHPVVHRGGRRDPAGQGTLRSET